MIIAWRGFCFRSSMCLWLLPLLFTITGWRTWQFIGDTDWTKLSTNINNADQFAQWQLTKTVVTHCYQVDQNYHQVDQGWRVPRQWDGAPRRGWSRHLVSILAWGCCWDDSSISELGLKCDTTFNEMESLMILGWGGKKANFSLEGPCYLEYEVVNILA